MKPARLPSELMSAMPAAAPVPARKAVGKLQNSGSVVRMPIVPSVSAAIASVVLVCQTAESTSPIAPATAGMAMCQRRSRVRSALRATRIMAMTAAPYGIAVSRPTEKGSATPVCLMSVGSQKLTPYKPITKVK